MSSMSVLRYSLIAGQKNEEKSDDILWKSVFDFLWKLFSVLFWRKIDLLRFSDIGKVSGGICFYFGAWLQSTLYTDSRTSGIVQVVFVLVIFLR